MQSEQCQDCDAPGSIQAADFAAGEAKFLAAYREKFGKDFSFNPFNETEDTFWFAWETLNVQLHKEIEKLRASVKELRSQIKEDKPTEQHLAPIQTMVL